METIIQWLDLANDEHSVEFKDFPFFPKSNLQSANNDCQTQTMRESRA